MEKRSAVRPQGRLSCTAVQQAIIDKFKMLNSLKIHHFPSFFMPEIQRDKFEQDAAVCIRDKAVMRRLDVLFNEFPEVYKCLSQLISTRAIPCLNSTLCIISPEGYRQSRLKKEESGYLFVSV